MNFISFYGPTVTATCLTYLECIIYTAEPSSEFKPNL